MEMNIPYFIGAFIYYIRLKSEVNKNDLLKSIQEKKSISFLKCI